MNTSVAVPKIFLRGNRWYVRVQVPTPFQDVLRRKEYWVSLRTTDRSVAVGRAGSAAMAKREEILTEFSQLTEVKEAQLKCQVDQRRVVEPEVNSEQTNGLVDPKLEDVAINKDTPKTKGKYGRLSKAQLIDLLESHDRTKKLGLVWEHDATDAADQDFVVAQIDHALCDEPAPWDNLVIEGDKGNPPIFNGVHP